MLKQYLSVDAFMDVHIHPDVVSSIRSPASLRVGLCCVVGMQVTGSCSVAEIKRCDLGLEAK